MRIVVDDFTFTTNDWGYKREYGTAAECTQEFENPWNQAKIRMNLLGTDFHFHPTVNVKHLPLYNT